MNHEWVQLFRFNELVSEGLVFLLRGDKTLGRNYLARTLITSKSPSEKEFVILQ